MKSKLILAAATLSLLGASAVAAVAAPTIAAAVADKGRPAADVERDGERRPAEMLAFAGVKPGQTVVDLIPGGGYFTRIFSKAVGPTGTVYAVSGPPRASSDPAKPAPTPAQDVLAADAGYGNIKSIHIPLAAGVVIPTKADVVWTSQNYHDLHNVPNADLLAFNKSVYAALKPGGVFVVLDHAAAAGSPPDVTSTLHRIEPSTVKKEVEAAGFKFEGETKLLANAADDHTKKVTDPAIRGHTDQFVFKFRKPK